MCLAADRAPWPAFARGGTGGWRALPSLAPGGDPRGPPRAGQVLVGGCQLNRYTHPRFGPPCWRRPFYPGYWIGNLPAMELSPAGSDDRGHFFPRGHGSVLPGHEPPGVFLTPCTCNERTSAPNGWRGRNRSGAFPTPPGVLSYYGCQGTLARCGLVSAFWCGTIRSRCGHDCDPCTCGAITHVHDSFDTLPTSELARRAAKRMPTRRNMRPER